MKKTRRQAKEKMESLCVKGQKVMDEGKEGRKGKLKKSINMRLLWQ
jgi:hypothetical protein